MTKKWHFTFLSIFWLYFFLMGRSRIRIFKIRIKFHLGRAKGRGKRVYEGRSPKLGLFLQTSHYLARYTLSHKLLVRQTSNHHHCNQHVQKPTCKKFHVMLSSSSWSKITLYIFGFQTVCLKKLLNQLIWLSLKNKSTRPVLI